LRFSKVTNIIGNIIPELYIVEITLDKINQEEIYLTSNNECFVRKNASVSKLNMLEFK